MGQCSGMVPDGWIRGLSRDGLKRANLYVGLPNPQARPDRAATVLGLPSTRVARSHVRLCGRARVTGVAFFDFDHGQTGVAPNAIELHPILRFRCLSG
jgi:hypothetical protein